MNAKKQARRDRAAARFHILSNMAWLDRLCDTYITSHEQFAAAREGEGAFDGAYARYVARKQVEAKALGIPA